MEERQNLSNDLGRNTETMQKNILGLSEHLLTRDERVAGQDLANEVGTKAARGKSAHDHIRIEKDSQETALNTSSSVRKPRASANGFARARSWSKAATAS